MAETNGHGAPNGIPGMKQSLSKEDMQLNRLEEIVTNALMVRQAWWQQLSDPRRDIAAECGYPMDTASVSAELYRQLYDREAIANRVVQCLPKESWQVQPKIYEDEDAKVATPFEQAWDDLEVGLESGQSWHQDEKGGSIWEHILRADILSGIGAFGVLLLGIDDGRNLQEPVDGVITINHKTQYVRNERGELTEVKVHRLKSLRMPDSPPRKWEVVRIQEMIANAKHVVVSGTWDKEGYKETRKSYDADYLNSPWMEQDRATFNADKNATDGQQPQGKSSQNGIHPPEDKPCPAILPDAWGAMYGMGRHPDDKPSKPTGTMSRSNGDNIPGTDSQYAWQNQPAPQSGTDQQYFGVQMGASERFPTAEERKKSGKELGKDVKVKGAEDDEEDDDEEDGDIGKGKPDEDGKGQFPGERMSSKQAQAKPKGKSKEVPEPAARLTKNPFATNAFPPSTKPKSKPTADDDDDKPEVFKREDVEEESEKDQQAPTASDEDDPDAKDEDGEEDEEFHGEKKPIEVETKRKLLFLRAFDESLVQIVSWEWNVRNPRFGQPVMYRITLNDPRQQHTGVGLPLATVFVHWSRVIHLADNKGSSEVMGVPRMQPVLNRLLDLRKLYSGSAEMYWRGAFPGWSLETNPQMGPDVIVDKAATRDMMENYANSLQRYLVLVGMSAKSLAPQVVDPTQQIEVQLKAIAMQLAIPVPVFAGYEIGEQASENNASDWNQRLNHRRQFYITPMILVPLIDRLIALEVLPEPEGYSVEWPEIDSDSPTEKSQVLLTRTQAWAAYISGGLEQTIPPLDYATRFDDMDEAEAAEMLAAGKEHGEELKQEQAEQAQQGIGPDGQPLPPGGQIGPDGQPLPPGGPPGQPPTPGFPPKGGQPPPGTPGGGFGQPKPPGAGGFPVKGGAPGQPKPGNTPKPGGTFPTKNERTDNANPEGHNQFTGGEQLTRQHIADKATAGVDEYLIRRHGSKGATDSSPDERSRAHKALQVEHALVNAAKLFEDDFVAIMKNEGRKDMAHGNAVKLVQRASGLKGAKGKEAAEKALQEVAASRAGSAHFIGEGGTNSLKQETGGITKAFAFLPSEDVYRAAHRAAKKKNPTTNEEPTLNTRLDSLHSKAWRLREWVNNLKIVTNKFSGEKKDSRGRRMCFAEGTRVKCEGGGTSKPTTPAAAAPAPSIKPAPSSSKPTSKPTPAAPSKSPNEAEGHLATAAKHARNAGLAHKAGDHDEAIRHADAARASIQAAASHKDASASHKETASKYAAHADRFRKNVKADREAKIKSDAGTGPNPALSNATRPKLSEGEGEALTKYSGTAYRELNDGLRKSGTVPPSQAQTHKDLQSAFSKAKKLHVPVQVSRGMNLDSAKMSRLLDGVNKAIKSGGAFRMGGYSSTSTSGVPSTFKGNVEFRINAHTGLDMRHKSIAPDENEFLLNHNTKFKPTKLEHKDGRVIVHLDQV